MACFGLMQEHNIKSCCEQMVRTRNWVSLSLYKWLKATKRCRDRLGLSLGSQVSPRQ